MQMDELKLIELIKCNDSIYNAENKRYSDKDYKIQLWNMIARELGVTVHQCRARWFNLRDSFRRSCRNRKIKGSASSKKWKYDDEMSFLVPFFHEKSNFDYSGTEDTTNCWDWGGVHEICSLNDTESNGMTTENCSMSCVDIRGMNGPETLGMQSVEIRGAPEAYLQDGEDEEPVTHPSKRRCLPPHVPSPVSSYTDIDLAFASLAATVNSFPAYQRYLAKTNCFKIVFELERELLLRGETQTKERQPDVVIKSEQGPRQ